MRCAIVLCLVMLSGCSASQQVAAAAGEVRAIASDIRDRAVAISQEASSPDPDGAAIVAHASAIQSGANSIISETESISRALPGVQDVVPWWGRALIWLAIAGATIAVCVLLWQTGIGMAIRRVIGLIPQPKQGIAKLAMEASAEPTRESVDALTAALRQFDPEINRAAKKIAAQESKS